VIKTRKLDIELNGELIKKDFEIPEQWSDRAGLIAGSKYAMDYENSALDIIDRVVNQITTWGREQRYFSVGPPEDPNVLQASIKFEQDLKEILVNQRASFNSPVWFNCGVPENSNQFSACFILPVEDTMEDILEHTTREGLIFRGGSGAGVNVSKLRAKGEKLSNKGTSSGPLSFMKVWDSNAGSIRSGGKNRRSAKLVCMDVEHPDIFDFIECKQKEEEKAKILIANGVDSEEAYETVAFQNTNHSIRVTDEFMEACEKDEDWGLYNRGDGQEVDIVKASSILGRTAEIAWATGDPGIQFDNRMNIDNPVPLSGRINSTNPCSEFSAIDNSSCNLASLNLVKYLDYDHHDMFDWTQFGNDIKVMITAMDILVDAADYPTPEIREVTTKTRPLGLGFTNLGAYLMLRGIPYDSEEARDIASNVTHQMTNFAYMQSTKLSKKLGPFEWFKKNTKTCLEIAKRLTYTDVCKDIKKYGLRNSQLTLLAPCGTISFLMDCDTTGIEPLYALKSIKTLAGGGTIEMDARCAREAFFNLGDYVQDNNPKDLELAISDLPEEKRAIFRTANEIHWKDHIKMMAACQSHLNGAISKTVNMPVDCTPEDIYDAYMFAWKQGIKSLAVYRDGSKDMQPLKAIKQEELTEELIEQSIEVVEEKPRKKLDDTRHSLTHKFNIGGFKGFLIPGMYEDGSLGEIFINTQKAGSTMLGLMDGWATIFSIALQYGVPLEILVDKFKDTRFEPNGIVTNNEKIRFTTSLFDYIVRWLEDQFLEDDEKEEETEEKEINIKMSRPMKDISGPPCINCGGITMMSGTCHLCTQCGSTSGCS
jgi:ribonucleoside-diphosphate reductase alpha chain